MRTAISIPIISSPEAYGDDQWQKQWQHLAVQSCGPDAFLKQSSTMSSIVKQQDGMLSTNEHPISAEQFQAHLESRLAYFIGLLPTFASLVCPSLSPLEKEAFVARALEIADAMKSGPDKVKIAIGKGRFDDSTNTIYIGMYSEMTKAGVDGVVLHELSHAWQKLAGLKMEIFDIRSDSLREGTASLLSGLMVGLIYDGIIKGSGRDSYQSFVSYYLINKATDGRFIAEIFSRARESEIDRLVSQAETALFPQGPSLGFSNILQSSQFDRWNFGVIMFHLLRTNPKLYKTYVGSLGADSAYTDPDLYLLTKTISDLDYYLKSSRDNYGRVLAQAYFGNLLSKCIPSAENSGLFKDPALSATIALRNVLNGRLSLIDPSLPAVLSSFYDALGSDRTRLPAADATPAPRFLDFAYGQGQNSEPIARLSDVFSQPESIFATVKLQFPQGTSEVRISPLQITGLALSQTTSSGTLFGQGGISVSQNYPNPFNSSTSINFSAPEGSKVSLKIFNLLGQEVAEDEIKKYPGGQSTFRFDTIGMNLSSGIYFARLTVNGETKTIKMVLEK